MVLDHIPCGQGQTTVCLYVLYNFFFFLQHTKKKRRKNLSDAVGSDLPGVPSVVRGRATPGSQDPGSQPCALSTPAARV